MADREFRRPIYQCPCEVCCQYPKGATARDHQAINRVVALLDEGQRRLFAGLFAWRRGHGGILTVSQITGLSRNTVRRGIDELRSGVAPTSERIRRVGGGRKCLEKKILAW
jgi:hypothetical protein